MGFDIPSPKSNFKTEYTSSFTNSNGVSETVHMVGKKEEEKAHKKYFTVTGI